MQKCDEDIESSDEVVQDAQKKTKVDLYETVKLIKSKGITHYLRNKATFRINCS